MKANHSPERVHGSAAIAEHATGKRSRAAYRRQLTATRSGAPGLSAQAKRAGALILEVLAGVRTPVSAASALGIRVPRYYLLEERAIQGLISACEPRPRGRTVSTDRRLAQLERELAISQRELARHQALARTTQRALGLAPPPNPSSTTTGSAQATSSGSKRRRRKPSVRALRAARLLNSVDSPSGEASAAVQGAVGSPPALGATGGGIRPVAVEAIRCTAQADHGGSNHAGRPKTLEPR
jgi:hypothetical protein